MKKNMSYIQASILNELMKTYTMSDVGNQVVEELNDKDIELSVYESHEDGVVFRKKKDGIITDDQMIKGFMKALRHLIHHSSLIDEINDNYEFEYDDKYITEGYLSDILEIRRSGRLISVEIDL